jgi:hypothetical protein
MFPGVERAPDAFSSRSPEDTAAREARAGLVAVLRLAYSGELAAAYAYRGHWKSVRNPAERAHLQAIEAEELQHRAWVGEMLRELGEEPDPRRELRMAAIGKTIGFLCRLTGWLIPMYGAGRLESRNIKEYEDAARHAAACGRLALVPRLLHMAEVEWDHEAYFRGKVMSHFLGRRLPLWTPPPPRENIRMKREPDAKDKSAVA